MVHVFFEHVYSKFVIALILCVIIAFADKIDILQQIHVYYIMMGILGLLIYNNKYDDYGMLLLFMALFLVTYNNIARGKQ